MFLNLDQTEGERFQFFKSYNDPTTGDAIFENEPEGDAWVTLRPIQPFLEKCIEKRKTIVEHVFNPKSRAMERLSNLQEFTTEEAKKERDDAWDYAIISFENFKDSKTGKEIECTRENKLKLMKIPVFDRFIARCMKILADAGVVDKEEQEKN